MKTKITAILAVLAASVFAFAETKNEAAPTAPEKTPCAQAQKCPKGAPKGKQHARPQISPEQREAHMQRVLLSLDDEQLAKLAERVAEIRKMTPEQKAEAIKALPKPEFRQDQKPQGDCPKARGPHHDGPKGEAGPGPRGPRGEGRGCACACGKGAPAQLPPPPPPADGKAPAEAPAEDAPAAE